MNSYQNKLAGYEQWAVQARNWVEAQVRTRSADKVRALNAASKAAFESNNTQFDNMNERLQRVEGRFDRLETGVQSILTMLQTLTAAGVAPAAAANNAAPAAAAAAPVAAEDAGKFFHFSCCHFSTVLTLRLLFYLLSFYSTTPSRRQRGPTSHALSSGIQHTNAEILCSPPCGVEEQGAGGVPECRIPGRLGLDSGLRQEALPHRLHREEA